MGTLLDRKDELWLKDHVDRWIREGLISREQGARVVQLETVATESEARPGLPLAAEVVAYLGSLLSLVAGAVVIGRTWKDFPSVARLAVGVAVMVAAFLAGNVVRRISGAGGERLAGFLWLVGAGGVALTAGVLTDIAGAGLARRTMPVVVVGAIGFLQYLQATLATLLSGAFASLSVLVVGLGLVVAVIVKVTRSSKPTA